MRQPIKFLPYFKSTIWGGDEISRFKGLSVNCKDIGESWELSAIPGCESIVMDGDDCGMTLTDMVKKYKGRLVGESVYGRYGDSFPLIVKLVDAKTAPADADSPVAIRDSVAQHRPEMVYVLDTPDDDTYYMPVGAQRSLMPGRFMIDIQQTGHVTDLTCADTCPSAANAPVKLTPKSVTRSTTSLVKCSDFAVNKESVDGQRVIHNEADSFMGMVCINGSGHVKVDGVITPVKRGESLLLPAHTDDFEVSGLMELLTVVIPTLAAAESDNPQTTA